MPGGTISHTNSFAHVDRSASGVRIETQGAVLRFTFDRPGTGNEVTGPMFDEMLERLAGERAEPAARVLRITALGANFCVGRERAAQTPDALRAEVARLIEFKRVLRETPLIVVSEVQGTALGFGFGVAICSDFSIAADHASLGFPEMLFGLPPMAIMAYLGEYALPRHAFPLVLLGEPISAERALAIGLINDAVPAAELPVRVDALIAKILALDADAVRNCKEFFRVARDESFDVNARLATERLVLASLALRAKRT